MTASLVPEPMIGLVYELLDAHHDTAELADELLDERWLAHLDYLRALQRTGREVLAKADAARLPLLEGRR
jgi:hypothetical protein